MSMDYFVEKVKLAECKISQQYKIIDSIKELEGRTRTLKLVKNIRRSMEHMCKFLVEVYLNIARTSLSVSGKGFTDLTTSHYELQYNQNMNLPNQERKGWFSKLGGG